MMPHRHWYPAQRRHEKRDYFRRVMNPQVAAATQDPNRVFCTTPDGQRGLLDHDGECVSSEGEMAAARARFAEAPAQHTGPGSEPLIAPGKPLPTRTRRNPEPGDPVMPHPHILCSEPQLGLTAYSRMYRYLTYASAMLSSIVGERDDDRARCLWNETTGGDFDWLAYVSTTDPETGKLHVSLYGYPWPWFLFGEFSRQRATQLRNILTAMLTSLQHEQTQPWVVCRDAPEAPPISWTVTSHCNTHPGTGGYVTHSTVDPVGQPVIADCRFPGIGFGPSHAHSIMDTGFLLHEVGHFHGVAHGPDECRGKKPAWRSINKLTHLARHCPDETLDNTSSVARFVLALGMAIEEKGGFTWGSRCPKLGYRPTPPGPEPPEGVVTPLPTPPKHCRPGTTLQQGYCVPTGAAQVCPPGTRFMSKIRPDGTRLTKCIPRCPRGYVWSETRQECVLVAEPPPPPTTPTPTDDFGLPPPEPAPSYLGRRR